jgi:diaminohydroxyphosphoribosylaminopyrimidine deaminase/5-amino-6-(5-phosphoribosylamino)uracil reductase
MTYSIFDHQCMAEALRLAEMGLYTTQPNPRVGCVIARDGVVVGRGYHKRAGGPHAEVAALQDAGAAAIGGTAYVTLEPCSHHGRTPPCVDALLAAGIRRVVMAMEDPYSAVNGTGRQRLLDAGVAVETGLMQVAAEALNPGFLMRMRRQRPFVRIKLAASLDGRTALANGESLWISSPESRRDVQLWRARSSAIMTGIGTVLADDPQMNVRLEQTEVQPIRVITDRRWRTPIVSRILNTPGKVIIAGSEQQRIPTDLKAADVQLLPLPELDGKLDLQPLLRLLADEQVNELQVEAGETLCGTLLQQGLADEILLYQAPLILGEGGYGLFAGLNIASMQNRIELQLIESCFVGQDQRLRFRPIPGTPGQA